MLYPEAMPVHPTSIDRGIQLGFIVAHRMLRAYWAVTRPQTRGALVAVWNAGELLIVKNSYRTEHTLPGGYRRPGETPEEAGARELAEECAMYIDPRRIREAYHGVHPFEFRKDDVTIVETEIETRPGANRHRLSRSDVGRIQAARRDPAHENRAAPSRIPRATQKPGVAERGVSRSRPD